MTYVSVEPIPPAIGTHEKAPTTVDFVHVGPGWGGLFFHDMVPTIKDYYLEKLKLGISMKQIQDMTAHAFSLQLPVSLPSIPSPHLLRASTGRMEGL